MAEGVLKDVHCFNGYGLEAVGRGWKVVCLAARHLLKTEALARRGCAISFKLKF